MAQLRAITAASSSANRPPPYQPGQLAGRSGKLLVALFELEQLVAGQLEAPFVGEKTGELEGMLTSVANAYEEQVEATMAAVTSLLAPS